MTKFKRKECWVGLALAAALGTASSAALGVTWGDETGGGNYLRLGGYLRAATSFNMADLSETRQDDKWDTSMMRGTVSLTGIAKTGPIGWGMVLRADQEESTAFTDRLEDLTRSGDRWGSNADSVSLPTVFNPAALRGLLLGLPASPATSHGPGGNVMGQYNQVELREFYAETNLTERLSLRLGKQQVVWGETDFFRAMDLVHGYDMRWRSFLEPENEELRKPLILANFTLQVPEAQGTLQAIVRPGWDSHDDIGNDYDLYGGRWGFGPFRGTDFLNRRMTAANDRRHPDGDADDTTYGVRWKAIAGPVTYSVAYLKTFNPDPVPVFNFAHATPGTSGGLLFLAGLPGVPAPVAAGLTALSPLATTVGGVLNVLGALGGISPCGTAKNPTAACPTTNYKNDPGNGALGEWIFPKIELLGFTATGYVPVIDSVLATEIVFTRNAPFATGTNFAVDVDTVVKSLAAVPGFVGILPTDGINAPAGLAGFKGIKKKQQLTMMFHLDKTLRGVGELLGTSELPFFTVQVFDKWILGFDKKDDIVDMPGYNAKKREHSTIVTAVLMTQFKNSTINPSLAVAFDPREGGGFLIPAVEFVFGDHWRLRVEADIFYPAAERDQTKSATTPNGAATAKYNDNTHLFGMLNNQDQLLFRLTRQF